MHVILCLQQQAREAATSPNNVTLWIFSFPNLKAYQRRQWS